MSSSLSCVTNHPVFHSQCPARWLRAGWTHDGRRRWAAFSPAWLWRCQALADVSASWWADIIASPIREDTCPLHDLPRSRGDVAAGSRAADDAEPRLGGLNCWMAETPRVSGIRSLSGSGSPAGTAANPVGIAVGLPVGLHVWPRGRRLATVESTRGCRVSGTPVGASLLNRAHSGHVRVGRRRLCSHTFPPAT